MGRIWDGSGTRFVCGTRSKRVTPFPVALRGYGGSASAVVSTNRRLQYSLQLTRRRSRVRAPCELETPAMKRRCAYCGKPFEPPPQVPAQTYCSLPDCQRARKRLWQRNKLQSDPDYQVNQRAAQQAWARRNPAYWRHYRNARPECRQRNRKRQRIRDQRRKDRLAKMEACKLPAGLYRITWQRAFSKRTRDSWIVEIRPVCLTCLRKMDASREDLIDTPTAWP